ncbi:mpv17 pmp22 family protein [Pyrenophora tritici-repentis]|uniref:Mpv17 pmp22 family protein n=1 Tax=Pyrenophora tritici-repentis TaxID=45151 RepID=A0A922N8D4_9PLEO|nr:mpv17 pmp22 family protein [Pyrenophora tritici-repentis]
MPLPPIAIACLSALAIDSCSNIIAQRLKAWNESKPFVFDRVLFIQFAIMVVLTAPVNYHWQNWLERAFPGWTTQKIIRSVSEDEEEKGMMLSEDGDGRAVVEEEVRVRNWWNIFRKWFTDELFGLIFDSYKVWPIANFFSTTYIPVERRIVFLSFCGLLWNIYLSLVAARL